MENDLTHNHTWFEETVSLKVKRASTTRKGVGPGFIWLGGYRSDMAGTKAEAMVEEAAQLGCSSLRFDYSGHGASGGEFINGTISRWVSESLSIFKAHTSGPQVLVGSSMGGWIALRLAQELKEQGQAERLAGLLLIAPAPDFTAELMEPAFSPSQKQEMAQNGFIKEPSAYSDQPNIITRDLIEDGKNNLVLNSSLNLGVPVAILQGMLDPDVPYQHALRLMENINQENVTMTLIKNGDHRLSRQQDIALLRKTMANFIV